MTDAVRKSSGVIVMIKAIRVSGVHNKWLALLNHIRHSAPAVYQITFSTSRQAGDSAKYMTATMERNPTWFEMAIVHKGCNVWVIKSEHIQKAVIVDE